MVELPHEWRAGPRYPIVYCWSCGARKDSAWSPSRGVLKPSEGDIAICVECGMPAIYTGHQLEQRPPTKEEYAELAADPEVIRLQMRAAIMRAQDS